MCDIYDYNNRIIRENLAGDRSAIFIKGVNSQLYNVIRLEEKELIKMYFVLSKDQLRHSEADITVNDVNSIFHEIGHVLLSSMANYTHKPLLSYVYDQSPELAMEVAGESLIVSGWHPIKRLISAISQFWSFRYSKIQDLEKIAYACVGNVLPKAIKDKKKLVDRMKDSKAFGARLYMFSNVVELLQIMGIYTNHYNDRNVLYLNKLSDCSSSLYSENCIRLDHFGYMMNSETIKKLILNQVKIEDNSWDKIFEGKKEINLNFYETLIKAYGYNPNDYFKRLEENKKTKLLKYKEFMSKDATAWVSYDWKYNFNPKIRLLLRELMISCKTILSSVLFGIKLVKSVFPWF